MFAYVIYAIIYGAVVIFTTAPYITAIALVSFIYVTLVFWNSERVGIWYGIPFRYHPDDHTVIYLLSYEIYFPRFITVRGLGHN